MFRRKIISKLQEWRNKTNRKPLVIRGARQVGKTTVVNQFGSSFDNYIMLNLEKKEHRLLFESDLQLKDIVERTFIFNKKERKAGDTLLFIDEIQNSPQAVAMLRYFYEDMPELYVIAAGSLLESLIDVGIHFPVGRVEYIALHPCSFEEFLGALGEDMLADTLNDAEKTRSFHTSLINLFNSFSLIGGMPEIVAEYASSHDIMSLDSIYETLLDGYRDDVEKYSSSTTMRNVIRHILGNGWAMAGETITLGNFAGSGYKAREVGEAFRMLEKTMILELVYPTTSTQLPPISDQRRAPKLIWLDNGLVNYEAKLRKEIISSTDILDVWRGKLAEQIVAQELLSLTDRVSHKRNFWVRAKAGSTAEVDFVYVHNSRVIPIEVKTGNNAHLRSLHSFIDSSDVGIAVRVWSQPFSVDHVCTTMTKKPFTLINIPFYLVGKLPMILETLEA